MLWALGGTVPQRTAVMEVVEGAPRHVTFKVLSCLSAGPSQLSCGGVTRRAGRPPRPKRESDCSSCPPATPPGPPNPPSPLIAQPNLTSWERLF